jgi:hypothetical protein
MLRRSTWCAAAGCGAAAGGVLSMRAQRNAHKQHALALQTVGGSAGAPNCTQITHQHTLCFVP